MQRIFSTFPDGWPGCGLLLLRITSGVPLFAIASSGLWGSAADVSMWIRLPSAACGLFLWAGLWTPFAAALQAVIAGLLACSGAWEAIHLMHAALGVSIAMLGPGYWSVDARLYGRRRIDLGGS